MLLKYHLQFKTSELKERLAHKEGEALMLASVNKQMEVNTQELETIKTKLIKERNDVAAVVRFVDYFFVFRVSPQQFFQEKSRR